MLWLAGQWSLGFHTGTNLMELLVKWAAAEGKPADEIELATKLVEDFSRFPTVDGMHGQLIGAAGAGGASPSDGSSLQGGAVGAKEHMPAIVEVEVTEASGGGGGGGGGGGEQPLPQPVATPLQPKAPAAPAAPPSGAELKVLGNAAFSAGRGREAVRLYTAALEAWRGADRHLVLSNRSAAYLRLAAEPPAAAAAAAAAEAPEAPVAAAEPAAAVPSASEWLELAAADARECTRLAPLFPKGFYRLGTSLLQLARPAEAVAALEDGLAGAPHNDELREALRGARAAQEKQRRAALAASKQSALPVAAAAGTGAVAAAAPGGRTPRVVIDYEAAAAAAARASSLVEERKLAAAAAAAAAASGGGGSSGAAVAVADGSNELPQIPRSAQQFEHEWAALRKEPLAARRRFLARLPAAEYAAVFRESLAEPTLVSLLECLDACTTPPPADADAVELVMQLVLQVLGGLASTRRFELLLMFLDKPRLACVARLFGALRASGVEVPASLAAAWGQK